MNLGRKGTIPSALFFFALAKLENIMYNIIYNNVFIKRYVWFMLAARETEGNANGT